MDTFLSNWGCWNKQGMPRSSIQETKLRSRTGPCLDSVEMETHVEIKILPGMNPAVVCRDLAEGMNLQTTFLTEHGSWRPSNPLPEILFRHSFSVKQQ